MKPQRFIHSLLAGSAVAALAVASAGAASFSVPAGDLKTALDTFSKQSGVSLMVSADILKGARTEGVTGDLPANDALSRILRGTGFEIYHSPTGALGVMRSEQSSDAADTLQPTRLAQAAPPRAAVETVTVTSSKLGGADVQSIPIAITALSQEQLTATQTAGGPDLVKQVPNLTFSKTNFTGYNIQIRGIGTQAISVTTDPAVAVALNDIPFIRNHFFEQEFYDVGQVEVLRGPQGTLYGRNATAGVVNVISAKPTDQFEAVASADIGNYKNRRFEGMINLPLVDDRADLRIAGEWTKRNGYSFNEITNQPIDGRDLWSGRVSLGLKPTEKLHVNVVWEHFQENDDRLRSGKQLCKTQEAPTSVNGVPVPAGGFANYAAFTFGANYLSQSCEATSLYSPDAFEVPYGFSLPYDAALALTGASNIYLNPYASTTQSKNLRVIESTINPNYQAKNDTVELNSDYAITPSLTFTSQTGYNQDFLWSSEDYNRFNTTPGIFLYNEQTSGNSRFTPDPSGLAFCFQNANGGGACGPSVPEGTQCTPGSAPNCIPAAVFCDPQLGCSDRIVGEDLSGEHAWQLSQELRLSSNFSGPLNFSVGGNYLHYETEENYYVFINALSIYSILQGDYYPASGSSNPGDNSNCLQSRSGLSGYQNPNPIAGGGSAAAPCIFVDTNPISSLSNKGHNYFLSQNPYLLNSYAGFGEAYYNVASDLKLTGGLRWTEDRKHFVDIPSEVVTNGYGYPIVGVIDQQWDQLTGRAAVNWTPKLDFTDQTLVYGSFAHGYKAGGANPPGAVLTTYNGVSNVGQPVHPLTFKPEFINAYELGTKNTMLNGALTLNASAFYYDYKAYQISEIVDRTSVNLNFDAKVHGGEVEASWEPMPGLKFGFAGGYEDTRIDNGQSAVDLMDRTASTPGWMVVKPFATAASNCILPTYVVQAMLERTDTNTVDSESKVFICHFAYDLHLDPITLEPYQVPTPTLGGVGFPDPENRCTGGLCTFPVPAGYTGFDPTNPAINSGEGFAKNLGGNQLPNAPHFTTSLTGDYTFPISQEWATTLHSDFYWQSGSFARVFNDRPYDEIHGYTNVNLALIFTSQSGWQVMSYLKNVFNTTAITGDFLNSDDSGLTTNIFLTDPRLFGVRVTKNW